MPHQGYQILQGGSSLPPLEAKSQYWIRRQTGSTNMLDGSDTNLYMTGFSQVTTQASNTMGTGTQTFPSTGDHKTDAISFNLSHSHPDATTFKVNALSLGTMTSGIVETRNGDVSIGLFEGSTAGVDPLYIKTYSFWTIALWGAHPSDPSTMWSRPNGATVYKIPDSGDSSYSLPDDLEYGTTYTIAWGWGADDPVCTANTVGTTTSSRTITTSSGTITATWSTSSFGGSSPWDSSNGTTVTSGNIPMIGLEAN